MFSGIDSEAWYTGRVAFQLYLCRSLTTAAHCILLRCYLLCIPTYLWKAGFEQQAPGRRSHVRHLTSMCSWHTGVQACLIVIHTQLGTATNLLMATISHLQTLLSTPMGLDTRLQTHNPLRLHCKPCGHVEKHNRCDETGACAHAWTTVSCKLLHHQPITESTLVCH